MDFELQGGPAALNRRAGAPISATAQLAAGAYAARRPAVLAQKDVNVYNINIGAGNRKPSINWSDR
jgi:hypothetical protein